MARSSQRRLRDLRDAYRLLGECRDLGTDSLTWRGRMLEGLRQLVGARVALYTLAHDVATDAERMTAPLDAGFIDSADRALWRVYQQEHAYRDNPVHARFYRGFTGSLRTRALGSLLHRDEWQRTRHYNDFARPGRFGDRIMSSLRLPMHADALPRNTCQVIVLHRTRADGDYPPRLRRLIHLFHHELAPLLGRQLAWPGDQPAPAPLPPRLRQVLACLLQGDGEKQAALRMGISRHTVNLHVQRLYKRFDVHSRGELMFYCRSVPDLACLAAEPLPSPPARASAGASVPGLREA